MKPPLPRTLVAQRVLAAAIVVLVVPLVLAVGAMAEDQVIREGAFAPRTILAERAITVTDPAATEQARATAEQSVEPVYTVDREAQAAIVDDVRSVFSSTWEVREPIGEDDGETPPTRLTPSEQREQLAALEPDLPSDVVAALVGLSAAELEIVEREAGQIARELALLRVSEEGLEAAVDDLVASELLVRQLPGEAGTTIVAPLIELFARPTEVVDAETTRARREAAAEAVEPVSANWEAGEAIVREGNRVDPLQYRAIERLGLTGSSPFSAIARSLLAMVLVTAVAATYLMRMQPIVWRTGKKLILLSLLITAYSALVVGTSVVVDATSAGWLYAVPAGSLAMLVALLIHPVVGLSTMLPAAILVLLVAPNAPAVALFAAIAVLVSVPLTTNIAKRSDLRSATLRAALAYPVLAAAIVAVFGPRDELFVALAAGAVNGVVTAVAVQGAMPFLETLFRLPTVTALLDLADRNHPLLRELETKALGSYNHSVMVASLTERACRAVGADPLLGSVAALYHDIGKVRQPHFFIENQQGIANPHDELEPIVSARIIQTHVVDGVEMATEHRLPPEVVACIGSHHGTMLVTYFYEKAIKAADGDEDAVDESQFRYQGHKPRSKEAAILLLADCCEATTRAMAMSRGTLPRDEIEATVDRLLQERIDDGQFEESDLTFRELMTARSTIVESLVGIYHPRIAYPSRGAEADADADEGGGDGEVPSLPEPPEIPQPASPRP